VSFLDRLKRLSAVGGTNNMLGWLAKYGALLAVFLVFFIPIQMRLSSYTSEQSSLKKETESLKKIIESLLTPAEVKAVSENINQFESGLADVTKANQILDEVTRMADEHHMKMVQIYSDSPILVENGANQALEVGGKKLSVLPVSFRVETDYKNLANFLKALSDGSKWTMTVEALQLQRSSTDNESQQCDITLSYLTR
jgi:Tfp pilus assembly protein PilO